MTILVYSALYITAVIPHHFGFRRDVKHAIDANDRQVQRFKTKISGRYVYIDRDCIG